MGDEVNNDKAWRLLQAQYLAREDRDGRDIGAGMDRVEYRLQLLGDKAFGCAIRAIAVALKE